LTIDNNAPKYGFKLWDYPEIHLPFEMSLFYGSYYYYLVNTEVNPSKIYSSQNDQTKEITTTTINTTPNLTDNTNNNTKSQNFWASKWGPIILSLDSLWTISVDFFISPPEDLNLLCIIMLFLFFKIIYFAHQLDKVRVPKYNNYNNYNTNNENHLVHEEKLKNI